MDLQNYTVITKQINEYKIGNNKNTDIYVYAYIKLCSDYRTGISHIRESKISENIGISEDTVSSIVCRLKQDHSLLLVETKKIEGNKNINIYHFNQNPENYFFIDNKYFHIKLGIDIKTELKVKGFLLLLKSICINNTNMILTKNGKDEAPNISQIAKELNLDRKTVKDLLDKCISLNIIKEIPNGYYILNDYFPLNVKDTINNGIYDTICQYCVGKGVIPPKRNKKAIDIITQRFHIPEKELSLIPKDIKNREQFIQTHSLLHNLNLRCKNLPSKVSMEYFAKILTGKNTKDKVKSKSKLVFGIS